MNSRLFAFGCSFTRHIWGTWADLISANFDEYYNFAAGGSSISYTHDKFIEVDAKIGFNSNTDTVLIGLTDFFRFSYLKNQWCHYGDFFHLKVVDNDIQTLITDNTYFKKENFDPNFIIYQYWTALRSIKKLLVSNGIKHKIIMAVCNKRYVQNAELIGLSNMSLSYIKDIYRTLDADLALNEYIPDKSLAPVNFENGDIDGHPGQMLVYNFIKKFLPEYNTDKTKILLSDLEERFKRDSWMSQSNFWSQFYPDKFPDTKGVYQRVSLGTL